MKLTLRDLLGAIVRTAVPAGVGVVLAWLATRYGIVLDETTSATVTAGAGVAAGTAYYALVRLAEAKYKWVGWLLGWNVAPFYPAKPAVTTTSSTLPPTGHNSAGPLDPRY